MWEVTIQHALATPICTRAKVAACDETSWQLVLASTNLLAATAGAVARKNIANAQATANAIRLANSLLEMGLMVILSNMLVPFRG
jgi:hypothetical protein